ncbi:MAG: putative Fe-S cluster assembly protein SufT [Verrucomicrobiota bacterium]|nr:putative Fe-S cluster assembly protein SufT [Verrucomicrobiota bacterium]MDP7441717.1 putative Fe-S cluster assembly protein SufT [Verrucomicrobiota bacterium]
MQEAQIVRLTRECEVTQIPTGHRMIMGADTPVDITQSLGGAYTVCTPRGLFRIDARDADALGFAVPDEAKLRESGASATETEVWDALRQVYDPEIPVNIVDLGLVYDLVMDDLPEGGSKRVQMKMTLTAPGCGMGPAIAADAQNRILSLPGIDDASVEVVWDPPWHQSMISEEGKKILGIA